jgi:hypothetical protein
MINRTQKTFSADASEALRVEVTTMYVSATPQSAQHVWRMKELEEDAWYREWVDRNNIRHERAKAAVA